MSVFGFFQRLRKGGKSPQDQLQEVLGDYQLPTFPGVVMKALRVLRDPDANFSDIGRVLAADPGLSVDVLRLANSAQYGTSRRLESVTHAVSMLGKGEVEALVISVGVRRALPSPKATGFSPRRFWAAAARRAAAAQAFANVLHPATQMESFTASLLQDMAIPLLVRSRGEAYNQVLNQWHARGGDLDDLEREQFPWDHSEVGSWMCASWDLPEPLAMAIHAHHSDHPDLGEECPPAVALVGFLREGDMEEGVDELIEKAGLWYGLTEEKCRELLDESFRRAEELVSLLV